MAARLEKVVQLLRPEAGTRVDVEDIAPLVYLKVFPIVLQKVVCKSIMSVHT